MVLSVYSTPSFKMCLGFGVWNVSLALVAALVDLAPFLRQRPRAAPCPVFGKSASMSCVYSFTGSCTNLVCVAAAGDSPAILVQAFLP